MGIRKNVNIGEIHVYKDPKNPTTSEYDVVLPVTSVDAVFDSSSGLNLSGLLDKKVGLANFSNPNLIINGDFRIWQRGEVILGDGFIADRNLLQETSGITSCSKIPNIGGIKLILNNCISTTNIAYKIPTEILKNGYYTLSFDAVASNDINFVAASFTEGFGVTDDINTITKIPKRFIFLIEVNNIEQVGEWIYLQWFRNVSSVWSGEIIFSNLKLEVGTIATPFTHRSKNQEMLDCNYYFQEIMKPQKDTHYSVIGTYNNYHALDFIVPVEQMRIKPQIIKNTVSGECSGRVICFENGYITNIILIPLTVEIRMLAIDGNSIHLVMYLPENFETTAMKGKMLNIDTLYSDTKWFLDAEY